MLYFYEKTNVDVEALSFEINESVIIITNLNSVTFKEPNELKIDFVSELTSAEKTELDSIVSSHTGASLTHYRFYCNDCADYRAIRCLGTPTKCPSCEGTNITDVVEQIPYMIMQDELQNGWEMFLTSDGIIINARRY